MCFMKTSILKLSVLWIFVLTAGSFAEAKESTLPKAPYIMAQEARQWQKQKKDVTFVDTREEAEFTAGHLEGAVNIPYDQVEGRLDEIDKKKDYVFYCIHSTWRAPYAANLLADHGYTNVYILEGGIAAWNTGGQVIESSQKGVAGTVAPYPAGLVKHLKRPKDFDYVKPLNLTLEELKQFDGNDGRQAYVAVNGIIYDVTQSRLWRGGDHAPSHGMVAAGRDLTEALKDSPHGDKHLTRFPVVGTLVKSRQVKE